MNDNCNNFTEELITELNDWFFNNFVDELEKSNEKFIKTHKTEPIVIADVEYKEVE